MRFASALLILPLTLAAADPAADAPAITIYSAADPADFDPQAALTAERQGYQEQEVPGFAVVRESRVLELKAGENRIDVTDVAARIDPATVDLVDVADPAALRVLESRFHFDLVSSDKLLDRYLDRPISVSDATEKEPDRRVEGVLLAVDQGTLVLRTKDGVRLWHDTHDIRLGELPGGLDTRPTLRWLVQAAAPGRRTVRTAYQTAGITWRADYRLVLAEDEKTADLGAWVSILNLSGASWRGARVKLIAGEVARVEQRQRYATFALQEEDGGFTGKAFFEYHLYTLGRATDLADRSTQQIALFPTVAGIAVAKRLVYDPALHRPPLPIEPQTDRDFNVRAGTRVDVHLRFANEEANRLGIPLPRGRLRLYKADPADGALEFLGEDVVDHTPAGRTVDVRVGAAFDVTGERKQVEFTVDEAARTLSERFAVTIANAKAEPVEVAVRERFLRWGGWRITQQSDRFDKEDASGGVFVVEVPAKGEKQLEYEVQYSW